MNLDSKLLTEAYLSKVVETAPSIKQIDDEIAALEREQDAAEAEGDKGAARDLEHEIMELEDEKRRLSLIRRNLRRSGDFTEDVEDDRDEEQRAWAQRDTDELEAMAKAEEDPMDTFDALLDGVIAEVEEQADEDDPKGMNKRREIGDLMVTRIYRKLMGINSSTGYTHQGRVFDGDFEG